MSERTPQIAIPILLVVVVPVSPRRSLAVVAHEADEAGPGPPGRRPARLPRRADRPAEDGRRGHHAAVDRPDAAARQRVRRLGGRAQPGGGRPDRGRPAGRQERRARRRAGRVHRAAVLLRLGGQPPRRQVQDRTRTRTPTAAADQSGSTRRSRRRPSARTWAPAERHGHDGGGSQAAAKPRFYAFDKKSTSRCPTASRSRHQAGRAGLADGRAEGGRAGHRGPGRRARAARPEGQRDRSGPDRWWVIQDRPRLSGTDIKDPEQNFDQSSATSRSSPSTSRARAARRSRPSRGGSPSAAPTTRSAATRSRPRSTSPSRWTTRSSPRRSSTGARTRTASTARPGADLRRLHAPVRAGPGEDPQDRRPAAEAQRWSRAPRCPPRSASRRSIRA